MQIKRFVFDGHPQRYHIAALVLAMVAMSMAFTTSIFAEEGDTITNTVTVTACSYSYSDWSDCTSSGKRYRTMKEASPTGCVQKESPKIEESCSYSAPACDYTYSDWSTCQSNSKQTRALRSKSPMNCEERTKPVLERSCTYTAPVVAGTVLSGSETACSYTYGDWGECRSTGKRYRTVATKSPTSCVEKTAPKTEESCTYSVSASEMNIVSLEQCAYSYSAWGTCQSNNKRTRTLVSKSPKECNEYTKPVLEQSCVYESAPSGSVTVGTPSSVTSPATPTVSTVTATPEEVKGDTTPSFTFRNVSDGVTFSGGVSIKGEVRGAKSVEYYLVPTGSNTYKYIGAGRETGENEWDFNFRSTDFPNGEFYLRVKVKNQYGEYGSGQRRIKIANSGAASEGKTTEALLVEEEKKKQAQLVKVAEDLKLPEVEVVKNVASASEQKKLIFSYCETSPEKCFPEKDTDNDGLSDIDEIRFGTDVDGADSDLDGFIDGDEVKNGFDPGKFSPGDQSDRIVFESPKTAGEVKKNYAVSTVELKKADDGQAKLKLSGKGLPNSFVTIYVYSDPIVLTIKTDAEGNWTYELDKELEDGEHEAYVAITDNTGRITGKSEPIAFVKTAQAVTVLPAQAATEKPTSVTESRTSRDIFFLITIIISAMAIALATIGLVRHRQPKNDISLS